MPEVIQFKHDRVAFEPYGDHETGSASIARLIGPQHSRTMGAGVARFDNVSIEWTVLYDELIVVLEGVFRLRVADKVFEAMSGEIIWIPENTPLRYEGEGATVFYALAPVDWQERQAT